MGTKYDEIFLSFKDSITDPDLLSFSKDLQTEMLIALMDKAIAKCRHVCKTVDLSNRDDELMEFFDKLPDDLVDIIIEWMTVFWLKPYLNNIENLRNNLSTKDFSIFSPANLLEKINNRYESAKKYARSLTNEYSYRVGDMTRLKS